MGPKSLYIQKIKNYRHLLIVIYGPMVELARTSYKNGIFYVEAFLPEHYPVGPSKCRFITPIVSPYIDEFGWIYSKLFTDGHCPSNTIETIILHIQHIMLYPEEIDKREFESLPINTMDEMTLNELAIQATNKYAVIPRDFMF